MGKRILQVFNRYLSWGGEEKSVDRIREHLGRRHEVSRCFFESASWKGEGAPWLGAQAQRTVFNRESARLFERAVREAGAEAGLFHNIYPVGSPSLYWQARRMDLPVIQYLHNFRPFSVGGSLWAAGKICAQSLHGDYRAEVRAGSWQNSILKSALFARALKKLHASGNLAAVKSWVAISDFARDKFIQAGVPRDDIFSLRHSWDAMEKAPVEAEEDYYLLLARLIEEKGVAVAIAAWNLLGKEMGAGAPRLLVAGEGRLEKALRAAARENPKIEFVGHVDGKAKSELLAKCRAVVAPSVWWEPLGLVVYEAYDFARPVLAAASGGLVETVRTGVTGFLHAAGDATGLMRDVAAMEAAGREGRRAMGSAGRDWLLENASPEDWKQKFEVILQHALR